jgi:hypothetical protein
MAHENKIYCVVVHKPVASSRYGIYSIRARTLRNPLICELKYIYIGHGYRTKADVLSAAKRYGYTHAIMLADRYKHVTSTELKQYYNTAIKL